MCVVVTTLDKTGRKVNVSFGENKRKIIKCFHLYSKFSSVSYIIETILIITYTQCAYYYTLYLITVEFDIRLTPHRHSGKLFQVRIGWELFVFGGFVVLLENHPNIYYSRSLVEQ